MCGISGIVSNQKNDDHDIDAVEVMNTVQHRRGPDDVGVHVAGKAVLGHTRLKILDLTDTSHQPMVGGQWVISYNGEVYNFRELRAEIGDLREFVTDGDAEVVKHAIDVWGVEKAVEKFNGMFAIAAWDCVHHKLYLYRDRMGIKPLYYHVDGDKLYFASSAAAIAKACDKTFKLSYDGLKMNLYLGGPFGDNTLFAGIKRLPPAHRLLWHAGRVEVKRWWKPEERDEDVVALLEDAVRLRKISDVPVALLLSGGVDSSTLACFARDIEAVHLGHLEEKFARKVADHFGMPFHKVSGKIDIDGAHKTFVASSGEASMAAAIPYVTCELLRSRAIVGLSANGGDELFFGYPRTALHNVSSAQMDHMLRHPNSFRIRGVELEDSMHPFGYFCENLGLTNGKANEKADVMRTRWFELMTYVAYDLNPTLDAASMCHGVEMRVPFLDHRVVEAALSLGPEVHIAGLGRKTLLKQVLRDHGVARECWDRSKLGFSMPPGTPDTTKNALIQAFLARGYVEITCAPGNRTYNYLMNTLRALEMWFREWVDTGKVSVQ